MDTNHQKPDDGHTDWVLTIAQGTDKDGPVLRVIAKDVPSWLLRPVEMVVELQGWKK